MNKTEWTWETQDGLKIHSNTWEPKHSPEGVICMIHGVGEHIGRYEKFAGAMTNGGFVFTGYDQRGFGKSQGRRGHIPNLEAYINDIEFFLEKTRNSYAGLPVYLQGHSMGGVLVLASAIMKRPKISGVISLSPGLINALARQKLKVFLAKILGNAMPKLTLKSGLDINEISRDKAVIKEYLNDPLIHDRVSAAWGKSMLHAVDQVLKNAEGFPYPLLIMHGKDDKIAFPESSEIFAQKVPKDKVTLKMWERAKHELYNDPDKDKIFKAILKWLKTQD